MKTLGERCVDWSYQYRGILEQPPGSNSGPFIREWLAACYRRGDDPSKKLGLTASNWCAAFACAPLDPTKPWCVLRPGEKAPHGIYAGVVEIVADALATDGDLLIWRPISCVREGLWTPRCGDLAIWDRSKPGDPSTSWWRHVNRVVSYKQGGTFDTIGGNESDSVREANHTIHNVKCLGFIQYPEFATLDNKLEGPPPPLFTASERRELQHQVTFSLGRILEDSLWVNKPDNFCYTAPEVRPVPVPEPIEEPEEELEAMASLLETAESDPEWKDAVDEDGLTEPSPPPEVDD